MNKHDQARIDALIKTLCKAKEQADTALLYLNAHNSERDSSLMVCDVLEHIEIALEQLGAAVPATF